MEVTLDKQYPVAAGLDAGWAVLSNIVELATCMPGAQITEEIDASHFRGSVRVKVGPAVAAFAGTIEVLALDPEARSMKMVGKGADKGGSSASMELTATLVAASAGNSTLIGKADVIVNGKFAQFGGRMINSVSDVILGQFADTFSQKAQALQAAAAPLAEDKAQAAIGGAPPVAPVAPAAPAPARELNAIALLWAMILNLFRALFGRKS